MLLSLSVQNYALIEHLEIHFSNQFSTITGETGAGKSILLGALGLIMGNRADLSSLKDKEKKCIVEATFQVDKYNLENLFAENALDYETTTIIRREILPSGKSRAFVNDTPTNLAEVQVLAEHLLDIHSQHETRELEQQDYQLSVLDAIGNNASLLKEYTVQLSNYKRIGKALSELKAESETSVKEQDYNLFLFNELEQVCLKIDEQKELEEELESLNNVELINECLSKIVAFANEEQIGFIATVKEAKSALIKIASFSKIYHDLFERLQSALIELEDITETSQLLAEKVVFDPERLAFVSSRLQTIYDLQKKHQVATIEELIKIQDHLSSKLNKVTDLKDSILKLEEELKEKENSLNELASQIHNNREGAIPQFVAKVENILAELGMPNAKFQFSLEVSDAYFSNGKDIIELLFSANKGTNFGTIKKVASGGEMSRIMLAIKSILADYTNLPTIIFDEIDTGVSGEIALKMAEIMKSMSEKRQVFAITHLPQIASKGNQHYKVFKYSEGDTTLSKIVSLTLDERVKEIAEMLSGKEYTESAINHAKTLLN